MSEDPDDDLLAFVAAHEVVLAQQAASLLQVTDTDTQERLELLREARLVTRVTLTSRLAPGYRITRKGTQDVDPALPPLRALSPDRHRHEIGVAWLTLAARVGSLGQLREHLTRRQMQAADTTDHSQQLLGKPGAQFADQPATGVQPDARDLYPDLGLLPADRDGEWVTVDLLLTTPDPDRLRGTLSRTKRDPLILARLFLVEPDQQIGQLINTTASELGIADQVHVKDLAHDGIAGT